MIRTRIRAGTAPEDVFIASGMFSKARTGQYPSDAYLGIAGLALKPAGEHFHPLGKPFQRIGDRRIGLGLGLGCRSDIAAGTELLDLVGKEKRREEKLARLAHAADRFRRVPGLAIDQCGERTKMRLLPVPAGNRIAALGDLDIHRCHMSGPFVGGEQPVDLRNRAFDFAAQCLVHFAELPQFGIVPRFGLPFRRRFDPGKSPFDPADCLCRAILCHGGVNSAACQWRQAFAPVPVLTHAPPPLKERGSGTFESPAAQSPGAPA